MWTTPSVITGLAYGSLLIPSTPPLCSRLVRNFFGPYEESLSLFQVPKKSEKKAHLNKMFDLKLLLNSFSPYYKWQMRRQTKLTSVSLLFPAVFQHYTHINWNYQNHIFTFLKCLLNWKFQIASFCTHGSLLTCSHSTGGNTSIMWTDMKRDSWDRGRQYEI